MADIYEDDLTDYSSSSFRDFSLTDITPFSATISPNIDEDGIVPNYSYGFAQAYVFNNSASGANSRYSGAIGGMNQEFIIPTGEDIEFQTQITLDKQNLKVTAAAFYTGGPSVIGQNATDYTYPVFEYKAEDSGGNFHLIFPVCSVRDGHVINYTLRDNIFLDKPQLKQMGETGSSTNGEGGQVHLIVESGRKYDSLPIRFRGISGGSGIQVRYDSENASGGSYIIIDEADGGGIASIANTGGAAEVYKNGLNPAYLRTLTGSDGSVTVTQNTNTIDFSTNLQTTTDGGSTTTNDINLNGGTLYFNGIPALSLGGVGETGLVWGSGVQMIDVANGQTMYQYQSGSSVTSSYGSSISGSKATGSAILGGTGNHIRGHYNVIAAGVLNRISGGNTFNFIGGGSGNDVNFSQFSSSLGGRNNDISGANYSVLLGGDNNLIKTGHAHFIGGGVLNKISGSSSIISSAIVGGTENKIFDATYSFIGAGGTNTVYANNSVIGGGTSNIASGDSSVVFGGSNNKVLADYGVAAGRYSTVQASHNGAFVLSDSNTSETLSSGANTLTLNFKSGVYVDSDSGIYINGNPVMTGSSPEDVDTLQTVTDRGNSTTNSIYINGSGDDVNYAPLNVSGANTLALFRGTSTYAYLQFQNSTTSYGSISNNGLTIGNNGNDAYVFQREAAPLYFGTSGEARMTILGDSATHSKVGIGTIAPASTAGSDSFLEIYGATDAGLVISSNNGEWDIKNTNPNADLDFYVDGSRRVTFAKAGNVGIGSATPSQKLDVAGAINILDGYSLRYNNSSNISIVGSSSLGLTYTAYNQHFKAYDGVSSYSEYMTIATGGNVGIGTAAPATTLHVEGTGTFHSVDITGTDTLTVSGKELIGTNANFPLATTPSGKLDIRGSSDGQIFFDSDGGSQDIKASYNLELWADYDNNNSAGFSNVIFKTDGDNERVRIDNNGKVGIGTNSPADTLQVAGQVRIDGATGDALTITSNAGASQGLLIYNDSNTDTASIINYYDGPLVLGQSNAEVMRLHTNGSVGIGTNSPAGGYTLNVSGDIFLGDNTASTAGRSFVAYTASLGVGKNSIATIVGRSVKVSPTTNNSLVTLPYSTDGTLWYSQGYLKGHTWHRTAGIANGVTISESTGELMRLTTGGYLGIGTDAPAFTLDARSADNTLAYFKSSTNKASIYIADDDTAGYISVENSYMSIGPNAGLNTGNLNIELANGFVGIGTNNPENLLDIHTSTNDRGIRLYCTPSTRPAFELLVDSAVNGNADWKLYHGTVVNTRITSNAGNHTYFNAGNVGVGTNNPAHKFHVKAEVAGDWVTRIDNTKSSSSYGLKVGGGTDSSDISFEVANYAGVVGLRVRGDQNVGIKNTNPQHALHVSGDVAGTGVAGRITLNGTGYLLSGDSPAETQTLQDVTDNGNTTTNSIIVEEKISGFSGLFSSGVGIGTVASYVNAPLTVDGDGGTAAEFRGGALKVRYVGTEGQVQIAHVGSEGRIVASKPNWGQAYPLKIGGDYVRICTSGAAADTEVIRFTASGDVGIGTDDPTERLEVAPDTDVSAIIGRAKVGYFGGSDYAAFGHLDSADNDYAIRQFNNGNTFVNCGTSRNLDFRGGVGANSTQGGFTASSDFFVGPSSTNNTIYVDVSEERVGINRVDVRHALDVSGAIRITSTDTGILYLGQTSQGEANFGGAIRGEIGPTYAAAGKVSLLATTWGVGTDYGLTEQLSIEVKGSDTKEATMVLLPHGGNVGIGTTNPEDLLTVSAGAGGSTTSLVNVGGTGNGRILVRHIDGKDSVSAATGPLFLNYGISENVLLAYGGGKVGIGATTNPARKLEVSEGSSSIVSQFKSTAGTSAYITLANTTSTADKIRVGSVGNDLILSSNYTDPDIYIEAGGKVGIGTNAPSGTLHVETTDITGYVADSYSDLIVEDADARIQVVSDNAGNNGSALILTNVNGSAHSNWAFGQTTTGQNNKLHIGHNTLAGGDVSNYTTTQDLTITTGGIVGIGSFSPSFKLDVSTSTDDDGIRVRNTAHHASVTVHSHNDYNSYLRFRDDTNRYWLQCSSDDHLYFRPNAIDPTSGSAITFSSGGNIGIGSHAPTERLEVAPDTDVSAIIGKAHVGYMGHADSASFSHVDYDTTSNYALKQNSAGNTMLNVKAGGSIGFNIANSTVAAINNGGDFFVDTDTLFVDASLDRVGINDSSPSYALDVNGTIRSQTTDGGGLKGLNSSVRSTTIEGFFANTSTEDYGFQNPLLANSLAGLTEWSNVTMVTSGLYGTRGGSAGSYTYSNEKGTGDFDACFRGNNSTISAYADGGVDGTGMSNSGVIEFFFPSAALSYSTQVGIVFGANQFRATDIKIEVARTGGWQTELDIQDNTETAVITRVGTNGGGGSNITGIRYTLNRSNYSMRINQFYAADYNMGTNADYGGAYYIDKYYDGRHYATLRPVRDGGADLGTESYNYDVVHANSGNFTNGITIDGNPVVTGSSAEDVDTLQTVTDRGNTTTNSIFIHGPNNDPTSSALNVTGNQTLAFFRSTGTISYLSFQNSTTNYGTSSNDGLTIGNNGTSASIMQREADSLYLGTSGEVAITIDSQRRVGIGTVTPAVNLDIYDGSTWAELNLDGANGGEIKFQKAGTTYLDIYASNAGSTASVIKSQSDLRLSSNNSTDADRSLYLDSDGSVGIGTDSPAKKLTVISDDNAGTTEIIAAYSNDEAQHTSLGYNSLVGSYSLDLFTLTSQPIRFRPNSTERMRITNDGYVGIGTNAPATLLQVSGGDITIQGADGEARYFGFTSSASTNTYVAKIESDHDANWGGNLKFFTGPAGGGNAERMRIAGDGDVGIGTNNPSGPLHVRSTTSNSKIRLSNDGNTNWDFMVGNSGYYSGYFMIHDSAAGERLVISDAGKVGIGTHLPSELLEVKGNMMLRGSTNHRYKVANDSNNNWAEIGNDGASSQNTLEFFTKSSSVSAMSITNDDNVGIGTPTPNAWLEVSKDNDNSGNQFCVSDAEGVSAAVRTYTHGGDPAGLILNHYYAEGGSSNEYARYADFVANVGDGAATKMRFITKNAANTYSTTIIDNSGNVGIGTADPDAHLNVYNTGATSSVADVHIVGSGNTYGLLVERLRNDSLIVSKSTTAGSYFKTDSATSSFQGYKIGDNWFMGQYGHNDFRIVDGTQSAGDAAAALTVQNTTKYVGIGTTAPACNLQVDNYTGAAGHAAQGVYGDVSFFSDDGDDALFLGLKDAAYQDRGWAFQVHANGVNSDLAIKEHGSSAERVRITTAGNVGIGTNAPLALLDVAGNHAEGTAEWQDLAVGSAAAGWIDTDDGIGRIDFYGRSVGGLKVGASIAALADANWNGSVPHGRLEFKTAAGATAETRMTIDSNGYVGIGTNAPSYNLDVVGTTRSTYYVGGAYLEENASSSKLKFYTNGSVLVMDEDGSLKPCEKENDTLVFGVSKKDFDQPIVLGAEPVLITGPIKVGDYIVTSNKQGHGQAMKEEKLGTIIAQAMENGDGESYNIKAMIRKI